MSKKNLIHHIIRLHIFDDFVRSNKSSGSSGGSSFGGRTRGSKKSTAAGSSFSTQFSSTPGGATRTTGSESTLATDSSMFHAPGADDLSAITGE